MNVASKLLKLSVDHHYITGLTGARYSKVFLLKEITITATGHD